MGIQIGDTAPVEVVSDGMKILVLVEALENFGSIEPGKSVKCRVVGVHSCLGSMKIKVGSNVSVPCTDFKNGNGS